MLLLLLLLRMRRAPTETFLTATAWLRHWCRRGVAIARARVWEVPRQSWEAEFRGLASAAAEDSSAAVAFTAGGTAAGDSDEDAAGFRQRKAAPRGRGRGSTARERGRSQAPDAATSSSDEEYAGKGLEPLLLPVGLRRQPLKSTASPAASVPGSRHVAPVPTRASAATAQTAFTLFCTRGATRLQ